MGTASGWTPSFGKAACTASASAVTAGERGETKAATASLSSDQLTAFFSYTITPER